MTQWTHWQLTMLVRYALYGTLLGSMFPLTALWLHLFMHDLPVTVAQILQLHRIHPSQWVLMVLPFFLGFFGGVIGRWHDRLTQLNVSLAAMTAEVRKQGTHYRGLFDHANDGIYIISREGRFLAVNPKLAELTGIPVEQLVGQTTETFLPGGFAQSLERIERIMREGAFGPYEIQATTPLGLKIFSVNAFAYVEDGAPVGIMCIARDVTEDRRRTEQEALYQLTHDLTHAADIRAMAGHLFVHTQHLLGADYGYVMLAEADGSTLHGVATYGMDREVFQQERYLSTEQAPAVVAFQQKQPVVVADLEHSPLISERLRVRYEFMKSFWMVPLMSGEKAVGIFGVGYKNPREATTEELRVLQLLGNEAALAMERVRLTEKLQGSEGRYHRMAVNFPGGMINQFLLRNDGSIAFPYVSPSCRELYELEPEEIQRNAALIMNATYPEDRAALDESITLSAQTLAPWYCEYRIITKSGALKWIQGVARPERQANGDILWDALLMDITERKRTEEARRESEERYRTLFEHANDGIVLLTPDGIISSVNRGFEGIVGWSREEVTGRHYSQFVAPTSVAHTESRTRRLQAGEYVPSMYEAAFIRPDGSVVPVEARNRMIRTSQGQPLGVLSIVRDITERKQIEAELEQAREVAEAANRTKSEFLANMSHEIRTPMNGIIGMTDLALDTDLTPEQREYLEMVKTSAVSLLTILNDILDFSKIEAGKLSIDPIAFRLRDCLGESLRALAPLLTQKGLELISQVQPETPELLVGDPTRLRQILVNLVGNAGKFTAQGEVALSVNVATELAEIVWLHFAVRDTGIGIPEEKQWSIFDPFAQADGSTARQYGGTGLGLAISSQLVALMGGRIWVESEVGQGSIFHFTLRFGRQDTTETDQPTVPPFMHGTPVLIVDDNATTRQSLANLLGHWGLCPTMASGGQEALAVLEHAALQGAPFPLVLLDADMPELDGCTVAARLQQRPGLAAYTFS